MSNSNNVYWSGIEYSYSKDSIDYKKLKGGFIYVFVKAFDVRDALEKLLLEMSKQKIIPLEIEFVSPYDKQLEWEKEEDTNKYLKLYEEALKTEHIVFDTFFAYEKL